MARSIEKIQEDMLRAKESENALKDSLNSTSKTAIWRLQVFIVAVAIWSLEKLFDTHRTEIEDRLWKLKPGTAQWYHQKALNFQYGFDLIADTDKYNNDGHTEDEIEASKVIKYCAVVDVENESRIVIKIATETGEVLTPVTDAVFEAFKQYISEIKYAGVQVTLINDAPDWLKLSIRIVRDKLVLDDKGMEILTGKYPVKDTIKAYMKKLPFNGALSLQALTDELQKIPGVLDLSIDLAKTKWIDGTIYGNWQPISISKIPESGYFTVNLDDENDAETYSTITYL